MSPGPLEPLFWKTNDSIVAGKVANQESGPQPGYQRSSEALSLELNFMISGRPLEGKPLIHIQPMATCHDRQQQGSLYQHRKICLMKRQSLRSQHLIFSLDCLTNMVLRKSKPGRQAVE